MALEALLSRLETEKVTKVTSHENHLLPLQAAPRLEVTEVTQVTSILGYVQGNPANDPPSPMRHLVRYRLLDRDGSALPGTSIDMPRPGETREQLIDRLRGEFGSRLILL